MCNKFQNPLFQKVLPIFKCFHSFQLKAFGYLTIKGTTSFWCYFVPFIPANKSYVVQQCRDVFVTFLKKWGQVRLLQKPSSLLPQRLNMSRWWFYIVLVKNADVPGKKKSGLEGSRCCCKICAGLFCINATNPEEERSFEQEH